MYYRGRLILNIRDLKIGVYGKRLTLAYMYTATFCMRFVLFHDPDRVLNNRKRLRKRHPVHIALDTYFVMEIKLSTAKYFTHTINTKTKHTAKKQFV